jgi:phosphoribosylglycinamide formyltransferase-1
MSANTNKLKLGVLVSGSGTNLQAIVDACEAGEIAAAVAAVISDNPGVKALRRADDHNIPAFCFERKQFDSKKDYETAVLSALEKYGVDLVCLAGYMRIVGPTLLDRYRGRMINIHPALLPSFPGLEAQRQAWEYGVKVAGCTVHFVDELADHGPIIAQTAVEVTEGDTVETLQARILEQEHKLYPHAIGLIADKKVRIEGRRVEIEEAR